MSISIRTCLGYLGAAAAAVAIILIGLRFAIDPVAGATSRLLVWQPSRRSAVGANP